MSEDTNKSLIFNWDYSDHRSILTCAPCKFSKIMIEHGIPSLKCACEEVCHGYEHREPMKITTQ